MKPAEQILKEELYGSEEINLPNTFITKVCIKAMKLYANQKIEVVANNIDWDYCYDGGSHCNRDIHEQSILNLKDKIE